MKENICKRPQRPGGNGFPAWLLVLGSLLLALTAAGAGGTWTPLTTAPPSGLQYGLLMSDGTVICANGGTGWYRLTPDVHGSYINGTWSQIASMNYSRLFFSSDVLTNGNVYVAGGEYGGGPAELYNTLANTWTVIQPASENFSDAASKMLPSGNVLQSDSQSSYVIYNAGLNLMQGGGSCEDMNETCWVRLPNDNILAMTGYSTTSEHYVPSLNAWYADNNVPVPVFGYGGELGPAFVLPNGNVFQIGATTNTAIYTPGSTLTAAGSWVAGPTMVFGTNQLGAVDAPAAMMNNGNILLCIGPTAGFDGPCSFYEYNYITNTFTQVSAPGGGSTYGGAPFGTSMLDLPDGTVLFVGGQGSTSLFVYKPSVSQLTTGQPTIGSITENANGSYHLTGVGLNGVTGGAAYGDDWQMDTSYPLVRLTNNASGNVYYARTYNWSSTTIQNTNASTTEFTLPAGLLPATLSLVVSANGLISAPYSLIITGTPLPAVNGLAFTTIASNKMVLKWSAIGLTETGYVVQRATNGVNYSTVASLSSSTTSYTDNAVTPLGQYYYQVRGTNSVGLGSAAPAIFAASSPVVAVPAPWSAQDVGAVPGRGASGTNAGAFTVIGSGSGIGGTNDQFQCAFQPMAGDLMVTARVLTNQSTGASAFAGVIIRNSLAGSAADAMMAFASGNSGTVFQSRLSGDATSSATNGSGGLTLPYWVRLVRTGNAVTGYTSPDGSTWTQQGTNSINLAPVVYAGLAVSSGTSNLLNTSAFDNVTVAGLASASPIPMAEWKLDETGGALAADSRGGDDGTYTNVVLAQPGATPDTSYSAGFNGTNANISVPPLNLNSNVVTITAWVNPNGIQNTSAGIFFNRANSTVSGLTFDNSTANELSYTWNNNANTYDWNSGLVAPANQWSFVALVIEPTRARIFMATNGVLYSATNNVANVVQAFDGVSYMGWDSSSTSRYFNGLLDEVQVFNQVLTPAQLGQLASPPIITFSSPTNGSLFAAPANINLAAALSGMGGHTANLVQFFNGNTLVGEPATPPFSATATNLSSGSYAFTARLFYDSGLAAVSSPLNVVVEPVPAAPQNVIVSALTTNLVYVSWSPVAGAGGYILNRNGTPISTFSTTNFFLDVGVFAGTSYCYTVVATNAVGNSPASASSCVTTTAAATSLNWDANSSPAGPQDGNGNWGTTASNWWNGAATVAWSDGNLAIIGAGTATNCIVTLTNNVAPSGIIFNQNTGGNYTITNIGGGIVLSGTNIVIANDYSTISAGLWGSGQLVVAGSGTLLLNNVTNAFTGNLSANNGVLQTGTSQGGGVSGYLGAVNGARTLAINSGATITLNANNIFGGGGKTASVIPPVVISGGTLNSTRYNSVGNVTLQNGATLSQSATDSGSYQGYEFLGGITVTGSSASTISTGNGKANHLLGGSITTFNVADVTGDSNVDLTVSAPLTDGSGDYPGAGKLIKTGAGTLLLSGNNSYTGGTTVNAGTVQLGAGGGVGCINGNLTINNGAVVTATAGNALGYNGGTSQVTNINVFGGVFNATVSGDQGWGVTANLMGGTLASGPGDFAMGNGWAVNTMATNVTSTISGTINTRNSQPNNLIPFNVAAGTAAPDLLVSAVINDTQSGVGIVKTGAGTMSLTALNTYTGGTIVSNGTLEVDGSIIAGPVTVGSGATLNGSGIIDVGVTIQSHGNLKAGSLASMGTLTINSGVVLSSGATNTMRINKTGATLTSDLLQGMSSLNYGGLLKVTATGNALATGDTFNLFNSATYSGTFATYNLPALAANLVWDTSQLATDGVIFVAAMPMITNQPQSLVVNSGMTAGFSVGATGNAPLMYQWRLNGTNLTGSTLPTLTVTNAQLTNAGNYTVVVTNNYGSVTSVVAVLTVNVAPTISSQPQSVTVYVNSNATFSVTAGGVPSPAYQWCFNGTNLSGMTATNFMVLAAQTTNEGGYTVVITNAGGSITSSVASLSLFREFGCAPLPYPSLLANNGARHLIVPGFQLGLTNPASTDARTNTAGQDGMLFTTAMQVGQSMTMQVIASAAGYLNGWIDFNTNGSWADAGDQIFTNTALTAGTNPLTFSAPTNAALTAGTWARFRFSSATNLSYTGQAPDGEVEDYPIAISGLTLTYLAGPNGTISGTTPQTVNYGANGTAVTAVPNLGYGFTNWSDGSTSNPRTDLNVTSNLAVTAYFIATNNLAPMFTGAATFMAGSFTLGGTGVVGQAYVLLTASNLLSPAWMPIATNLADTNGVFIFTDPNATNLQQFYRLGSP